VSQLKDLIESFSIDQMEKILSSLANEDSLKIFIAAKEGIKTSTGTIKELGLTPKRYYTRLSELVAAGLVEKRDDVYQLTAMGRVCYTLGEAFQATLDQRDRLDLADRLRSAKSISLEETQEILRALSSKGIIGSLGIADMIQPVKMIEDYETVVSELTSRINGAQESVCLASRYIDSRVAEATLRALGRNVRFSLLTWEESLSDKLQLLHAIMTPKIVKGLLDLIGNKEVRIKNANVPYSFCVIDGKFAIIELPNPLTKSFYVGFSLQNEALCQRLIKTFEDLYLTAKEDPAVALLRKL